MAKTHLDEIVDVPSTVIRELYNNNEFVSLITNIPNADIEDEVVEDTWDDCMCDYDYVDGTVQENRCFCCVDTTIYADTETIKQVYISIVIGVPHSLMSLKGTKFTGIKGNRRDNLIRMLDLTLRDSHKFGIGGIVFDKVEPVSIAGKAFSCKRIIYEATNFAKGLIDNG